jgi:diaminopimelate decarboxylase
VNINIDSLSNLEKFGKKYGHSYPVGIRLRPNIMAGGNLKISTGHEKSKFGIPIEQLDKILALVECARSFYLRPACAYRQRDQRCFCVYESGGYFFDLVPHFKELVYLDLGGGFKVPYREEEEGTDVPLLGEKVAEVMQKLKAFL